MSQSVAWTSCVWVLLLLRVSLGTTPGIDANEFLEQDDECHTAADSGAGCALHALQRLRPAVVEDQRDHPFIKDCDDAVPEKTCPSGLTCVFKPDRTWSQCVDCSSAIAFWKDCIMMNEEMRTAATEACGLSCPYTTPAPILQGCASENGVNCTAPQRCATKADGTWSQCVDCSHRFYHDCQQLNDDMRHAAVQTCKRTCQDTRCYDNSWCLHPYQCVGDEQWSQCLRCDRHTFSYSCHHWQPAFRSAAEKFCRRRCRG